MDIKHLVVEKNNKPLYDIFKNHLNATDEYGIENTHSIIRSQTCDGLKSCNSLQSLVK